MDEMSGPDPNCEDMQRKDHRLSFQVCRLVETQWIYHIKVLLQLQIEVPVSWCTALHTNTTSTQNPWSRRCFGVCVLTCVCVCEREKAVMRVDKTGQYTWFHNYQKYCRYADSSNSQEVNLLFCSVLNQLSTLCSSRSSLSPTRSPWAQRPPWTTWTTTMRRSVCPPSSWSPPSWARWRAGSCAGLPRIWKWRRTRRTCSWSSASPQPTSQTGEKRRTRRRRQLYWTSNQAWHSLVSWTCFHTLCFTLPLMQKMIFSLLSQGGP